MVGTSFGGWVVPVAANLAPQVITYTIVIVGGVVSTGQEALYDDLTGYSVCQRTATPMPDILQALRDAGPSGFDPRPSLEALSQPGVWVYGGQDLSHSADFSAELLAEIEATMTKDWTVVVVDDANHEMIAGGGICDTTGPPADPITPLLAWMDQLFGP